jgi:hypothetical protein
MSTAEMFIVDEGGQAIDTANPFPVNVVSAAVGAVASASITSVQTSATGANWVAFSSSACDAMDFYNGTGTTLEYRRGATGTAFQIPSGVSRLIVAISNANQIDVRRVDQSNSQVTAYAERLVY